MHIIVAQRVFGKANDDYLSKNERRSKCATKKSRQIIKQICNRHRLQNQNNYIMHDTKLLQFKQNETILI